MGDPAKYRTRLRAHPGREHAVHMLQLLGMRSGVIMKLTAVPTRRCSINALAQERIRFSKACGAGPAAFFGEGIRPSERAAQCVLFCWGVGKRINSQGVKNRKCMQIVW